MELSQSFPTPYTSARAFVVLNVSEAPPMAGTAPAEAPIALAPVKATTVKDWSYPLWIGVEVTVTLDSCVGAVAFQISAVPACASARRTSVHVRPAPDTVNLWPPEMAPSDAAKARRISPGPDVLNAGVVRVPLPSEKITRSTATSTETGGGPDDRTRAMALPMVTCVPTVGF